MDDWIPTNTGNSVAGDGAFERFITAAVAAIITIMFSWRLLAEQSEAGEEEGAVGGGPRKQIEDAKVQVREELVKELTRYKQQQVLSLSSSPVDRFDGLVGNNGERDGDSEGNTSMGASPVKERKIQDISLDEYRITSLLSSEGQGLKKWPSIETNDDSGFDSNRWTSQSANDNLTQERSLSDGEKTKSSFQDFLDEEFDPFFDPFGNSDPFDDNAEPRVLDSDEEMYCCNMLETIMEEDSDEIPSSESDNDSLRRFNPHKHKKEGSGGESDNDSLKRSNPKKFKSAKSGSESDSDTNRPHDIEPQNGQLKRYATQKLENESLLEVVVPEQKTNVLNNSIDSDEDEEYSGSSTSHVTLFTRETVSIQDSEGTLARTNTVHKIKVPFSEDLTIHQLMARAVAYPIEAPPEETNSSESDESVVTVLTRQNSSTAIDSNGSPKMIENVPHSNASSAFPVLTPGNLSDDYRSDDHSSTSQIEAGTYSSINTPSAYYNNSTCEVTSTQFVHIPPNSSWIADRNNVLDNQSSSIERQKNTSPVNNTGDYDKAAGHVDINKDVSNLISDSTHSNKPSDHNLQPGIEKIYTNRAAELVSQHKLRVDKALENLSGVLHNKNREGVSRGDKLTPLNSTGQTNQSKTIDLNSDKTISEKSVNNTGLRTVPSVSHDTVINQKQLKTINSETNPISNEQNECDNVTENCDRVKYVDAQESTAVKNSPQSFTFIKDKEHFIDFHQTNYTLNRDQEDIQSVQDNLETDFKPVPIPRKRLSIDNSKAIEENDSVKEEPSPKIQKSEGKSTRQNFQLKVTLPQESNFELDNDSDTHPDLTALKRQELTVIEHSYNRKSDIEDSDEIADQSFDDDDFENLACVEEVIGKYKTDASPKIQLNNPKEPQEGNPHQQLETNIDDVFDEEEPELIEVFDEETGLWVVQSQDGTVHELLNDVPIDGESERAIFLKRCVRQSTDDLEPGNFLDFSRGVEESPPDGGSPARTSSPVLCLNERPKPRFQLTPLEIEPVLKGARDKLNRKASVEDSPVLKFDGTKPKLSKEKNSGVDDKTRPVETIPKRSSRQTPIRRTKSKETTFGPEPNTSSKETTFGPEPEVSSNKTKVTPEPVEKPKQEPEKSEVKTQSKKTHHVSIVEKTEIISQKSTKTKKQDRKIQFKENVKPSSLEIKEPKSKTTIERDNPFRVNTPERNRNIEADVLVHKPQETCIDDVLPPPKETVIDGPVVKKPITTDIDGPLERENPFIKSNDTENIYIQPHTGPKPGRYRSKETLIDSPPTLPQKDTPKEKVDNQKSGQRKKETLIDGPPMKSLETSIDDPSPTIESKPITRHRSRETLIDDISPVIKLPSKTITSGKETIIDSPVLVESSPIVSSPTLKSPVVKLPKSPQVTAPRSISNSRETLIDDPKPHKVGRLEAKETCIDEPTYIHKGPTVKVPVNGKPVTKNTKSLETSIDDYSPQQRTVHESPIDIHTTIQKGPTLKASVIKGTKSKETSISPKPTVKETSIDDPPYEERSNGIKESAIDDNEDVKQVNHHIETLIDGPVIQTSPTVKAPQVLKSPTVTLPPSVKTSEAGYNWSNVQLPSRVSETVIDDRTTVQQSPIVRPTPTETSIDDPCFPLPPKITDASIYESIIVVKNDRAASDSLLETPKNNVKETVIDEPGVTINNHIETNIDDVFDSVADDSVLESPRSSITSTSYSTSVSSPEQNLTVDVGPKLKLLPSRDTGFDGPASPNSRQSDIDDHNITNPTSSEITSSEDFNNSEYDDSINDVGSQLDDSSLESDVKRKPRSLRQIKRKIAAHRAYKNSLHSGVPLTAAQLSAHTNREDIIASRLRFLSEGNLSKSEKIDRQRQLFDDYKKHLLSPLPKIGKFTPNKRYRSKSAFSSIEKINHITELYASRIDSDESFRRPHLDELHANCILSPEGRREIHDKTLSIENLNEHLRRFGSVTSLVETDLDTWETSEKSAFPETDLDLSLYLQQPSDRAVSMTDLRTERAHRKPASRRFADRHLAPKSKSLQTLETNIDDDADDVFPDTVSRTPSVHELRVTKSLQKLNVPDWYKHSNLSKSASTILRRDSTSTMSSFGYSAFSPSLMSSPTPSVVSQSSNVVIKTRITPTSSSRIFRKYTPATNAAQDSYRRSVLDNKSKSTPNVRLPSAQFREKEKPKGLMPVPILPFRQIRAMFEAKAANAKAEQRRQEDKPKSPEMSKKESVPIPTVTFSDDENGPESPINGKSVSPRPSSPQSPTDNDKTKNKPKSESSSLNTSFEKRLPKPILKLTEHFTKSSKSKSVVTPPRVKSPETVLPASNIQAEATISIPESAVIKRPVMEITEPKQTAVLNKSKPQPPPKPEPKPRRVDSTTRTPESQPPPPPSDNVSRNNDTTPSINHDKPAAIRLGNSNNQSHKVQSVPSTSIFARAKASLTPGRSVKETTV